MSIVLAGGCGGYPRRFLPQGRDEMMNFTALVKEAIQTRGEKLDPAKLSVLENARGGFAEAVGGFGKLVYDVKDSRGPRISLLLKKGSLELTLFTVRCGMGDRPWFISDIEDGRECHTEADLERAIADYVATSPYVLQNLSVMSDMSP